MDAFIPKDVVDGIRRARILAEGKKRRLRVRADGVDYPIRRLWRGGFSVDAEDVPDLRGFVDLYDGGRHLLQCLIIRSDKSDEARRYEFKRCTEAADRAPVDYEIDPEAPVALLR